VVGKLSSKDHLTYYEVKERSLILPSNHWSPSRPCSKNPKPQHEANAISSLNGKKPTEKNKASSSYSNSGGQVCNWYRKHFSGTVSSHIWTPCKELKARQDKNGAEMAAPIQEVANTVSSNSSKWIFDIGASSHMTPASNCFESFSSV
jgi:hypothetical protein